MIKGCFTLSYVALMILFTTSKSASAQWSIEVDPFTYALDGYSLHARFYPEATPQWRMGVGIYSMEMPNEFVDMNSDNEDEDWDVELDRGLGLFAERYFNETRTGWFVGLQTGTQKYEIENARISEDDTDYTTALVMPYGGYLQQLTPQFYVQYWGGFGYNTKVGGSRTLDGEQYDVDPFTGFATLHLGYKF